MKIEAEFSLGGSASILEINELEEDTWHTRSSNPIAECCVFLRSVSFPSASLCGKNSRANFHSDFSST